MDDLKKMAEESVYPKDNPMDVVWKTICGDYPEVGEELESIKFRFKEALTKVQREAYEKGQEDTTLKAHIVLKNWDRQAIYEREKGQRDTAREFNEVLDELRKMDCGDNSCVFAKDKRGARTNGGCRCLNGVKPDINRVHVEKTLWLANAIKQRFEVKDG